jgi:uncharacterized protein (TIGR03083 family)
MSKRLQALRASVEHLQSVANLIDPSDYESPAYPSDWTIADTFSHIGSGAVITKRRAEDSVADRDPDPDFNASVWDEWNAKAPQAQVIEALAADQSLLAFFEATTTEDRSAITMALGPMNFDFDGVVGLRLSEHAVHTWDVEVASNPDATLPADAANLLLDNAPMYVGFSAKPTGVEKKVSVRTSDSARDFTLEFKTDSVGLSESRHDDSVDLELPSESFVRLIYGRLDPDHTPSTIKGAEVEDLRAVFPGF